MNNALATQSAPYSQEAEEAVIGAVLISPAAFLVVSAFLKSEDFFFVRHGYVWIAIHRLHERSEPIDYLTVLQELKNLGWLEEIGGPAYITYLINNTPTSIYAETYGRLVQRAALRRRLMMASDEFKALALNEELTIEAIFVEVETKIFDLTRTSQARKTHTLHQTITNYFDDWERAGVEGGVMGLPTGFVEIDKMLLGMHKGDMLIIGGPPGAGKTAFMLSLTLNVALVGGRVGIFTLEMSADQITQRLLATETGINTQKIRAKSGFTIDESSRLVEAMGRLNNLPIYIDDNTPLEIATLRSRAKSILCEHGLDLLIVDYIQLVHGGSKFAKSGNRTAEMDYVAYAVKELAREFNIPVLVAAQLNRELFKRKDKRPTLPDLRESGALEQAADVVMFVYRDEYWNPDTTEFPNQAEVIIAKQRNGPTGIATLYYDKTATKFSDGAVRHVYLHDDKDAKANSYRLGNVDN